MFFRLFPRLAGVLLAGAAAPAAAELFINEIYFDPPLTGDENNEYVELRGTPGMSLADHYLIFLEGESSNTGNIDNIFDLGGFSLGSNGFLTFRQKGNDYPASFVDPDSANFVNDGPNLPPFGVSPGFGNGAASTVGASDSGGEGRIENGAFTAMLIHNVSGAAPVIDEDLDVGNDGLDVPTGKVGWEILDAVAIAEEDETLTARFYAPINFAAIPTGGIPQGFTPLIEPGAEFVVLDYELEYVGRWGNSTGQTAADWHVSNLTDRRGAGFQRNGDFRQAGDPHPEDDDDSATPAPQPATIETNQGVPYGTILTDTIGAPNYITGDFNGDGVVSIVDYTVWRDTLGDTGLETAHPPADPNHDFVVDNLDYDLWAANFGAPSATAARVAAVVPEPMSVVGMGLAMVVVSRRRR